MASETEFRPVFRGLVTEPSRIVAGDAGLIECENAVCKRPGLIEPRNGFAVEMYTQPNTDDRKITSYVRENVVGDPVWFAATNGTNLSVYRAGAAGPISVLGDSHGMRAEPFADRQCWTFPHALRMLDTPNAAPTFGTFARYPGAPRAPAAFAICTNPGLGGPLPPNSGYAYRVLICRYVTTAAGVVPVYGAPCDRIVVYQQDALGLVSATVQIGVSTVFLNSTTDEIQIYRTPLSTVYPVDPGDEMQLLHAYRPTGGGTYGVSYVWTDNNYTNRWGGASLYTNNSQEGLTQQNARVRLAKDVAYYNSMAFYAQASRGYSKTITVNSIALPSEKGLYSYTESFTSIAGSKVLTATTAGFVTARVAEGTISVGQLVNVAGNDPETAGAIYFGRIVSWNAGANTITLDTNSGTTVGGAGTAGIVWDWIGIELANGTRYLAYCMPPATLTATYGLGSGVYYYSTAANQYTLLRSEGAQDVEWAWNYHASATSPIQGKYPQLAVAGGGAASPYCIGVTMRFDWADAYNPTFWGDIDFTSGLFEVVSSKPYCANTVLGTTYAANLCRAEQDGAQNRLAWSKLQLPEAVPFPNYVDVGDSAHAIVRIVATQDSLWIFKTDGLWRWYGDAPDDYTLQQVDTTFRMVVKTAGGADQNYFSPWVRRLGNTVYAWTQAGIFAVDSSGTRRIDDAIQSDVRALSPSIVGASISRPWASSGILYDTIVFGAGGTLGFALAYHVGSGTWSRWSTQIGSVIDAINNYTSNFFQGTGETTEGGLWIGSPTGAMSYQDGSKYYSNRFLSGTLPLSFAETVTGSLGTTLQAVTLSAVVGVNASYTSAGSNVVITPGCIIQQGAPMGPGPSNLYLVVGYGPGTITVDRNGLANGAATVAYVPIKQTITYAATTEGSPSVYKFFKRAYWGFQQLRGGIYLGTRMRARGVANASSTHLTAYPNTESSQVLTTSMGLNADREWDMSLMVPTEQTQATGLEVTIELNQACVYSAIDGMTVTYAPKSQTVGGRS